MSYFKIKKMNWVGRSGTIMWANFVIILYNAVFCCKKMSALIIASVLSSCLFCVLCHAYINDYVYKLCGVNPASQVFLHDQCYTVDCG